MPHLSKDFTVTCFKNRHNSIYTIKRERWKQISGRLVSSFKLFNELNTGGFKQISIHHTHIAIIFQPDTGEEGEAALHTHPDAPFVKLFANYATAIETPPCVGCPPHLPTGHSTPRTPSLLYTPCTTSARPQGLSTGERHSHR